MARRKSEDERDNHERWLVSYADFITLLFAFFVVMYALSSVNEGKYRILSNSMVSAFRNVPVNSAGQTPMVVPTPPPARRRTVWRARRRSSRNSARKCATSRRTFLK
jgi:chemotaxis protein MotB